VAALRVLILARSLPMHGLGGMEAATWDLARALARRGCAVRILTTACPGAGDGMIEGVDVRFLDAPAGRYSPDWSRESVKAYERDGAGWADAILSVSAAGFPLAAKLAGRAGRPVQVMQAHGTSWLELVSKLTTANPVNCLKAVKNIRGLVWDRAYRFFDAVVAIGPAVSLDMRRLPTRLLIGDATLHEISNGIDEEFFAFSPQARARLRAALGVDAEAPVVVTTTRLHPQKGVAQALAAFEEVRRTLPLAHYIVVGDGPERVALEQQAQTMAPGHVHFVGAVSRSEVVGYLSAGDVFVFTTQRQEGLPLNLLEAFASGLPAVLSAHIRESHFPAVGVDPQDSQAIAAAILSSLTSATAERHSTLPPRHSLIAVAAAYEETLTSLIASRGGRGG